MPKKKKLTQNKELLTEVGLKFISILNKQLPEEKKITEEQLKERLNNQTLFDQASKYQEAIDKQVSLKAIDSALRKEEHIDGHNMVSGISRLISHKMKIENTPEAKEYNKGLLQDCFNKDKVGEFVSDALKFAYTIDYTALGKATDEEKIDFYTKNEDKIMILHSIKSIADSADIQVPPQMKQDFLDNVPIFEALNDIEVIRANKTKTVNFFIPEDITLSNEQIEAMMPELMQAMSEIPQSKFDEQDTEPYQGMDVFNELQSRNSVHSETTQFIYEEMAKGNISSLMTSKNYYLNGEPVNISTAAKNKNEIQMSSKNMDVQKAIKSSLDGRMALQLMIWKKLVMIFVVKKMFKSTKTCSRN